MEGIRYMASTKSFNQQLVNRFEVIKRRNVDHDCVVKYVNRLLNYVDLFNSIDEYSQFILNRDIKDIEIPTSIAPMIAPKSIRGVVQNIKSRNLVDRKYCYSSAKLPDKIDESLSYSDYINVVETISNWFKTDFRSITKVSLYDLRKDLPLFDNIDLTFSSYAINDIQFNFIKEGALPIPIMGKDNLSSVVYESGYFNYSLSDYYEDFISKFYW